MVGGRIIEVILGMIKWSIFADNLQVIKKIRCQCSIKSKNTQGRG